MSKAILLISCPDAKGINATVTDFIFKNGGNIIHADQHLDDQHNIFFMRVEWSLAGFKLEKGEIGKAFSNLAAKFKMTWELYFSDERLKAAIFVSKPLHCLYDLLSRQMTSQLACDFPVIISNHTDAQDLAKKFDLKFYHLPKDRGNKSKQEKEELAILKREKIDFLLLARYHQIFSKESIAHFPNRIINIHHSF